MHIREAILRNCYLGNMPGTGDFTISENAGYIVFTWPGGQTTRMRRAENGVDTIIPTPNGDIRVSGSLF